MQLVHITDTHLFATVDGKLMGVPTHASLTCVLDDVRFKLTSDSKLLFTGDLSQDESDSSYYQLASLVRPLEREALFLPGNHDEAAFVQDILVAESERFHGFTEPWQLNEHWVLIPVDSTIPGKVGGHIDKAALLKLKTQIEDHRDKNIIVAVHHHPLPMQSQWLDNIAIDNSDDFWAILAYRDEVKCVVFGHVHQEYDQVHQGIRVIASPSTCVQFTPQSEEFIASSESPGYRLFELNDDGSFKTTLHRVGFIPSIEDRGMRGY